MPITITHEENQGSPKEDFGDNGFVATRELICNWEDRFMLADELLGQTVEAGGGTTYVAPAPYPHQPELAIASACSIAPFTDRVEAQGGDTTLASYEKALLTVRYGSRPYPVWGGGSGGTDPAPFIEETIEPFAEFLTLPTTNVYWHNGGTPKRVEEDVPLGILLKGFNWSYTRHKLKTIPASLWTLIGKVNSATVTSNTLGFTFPAETLLFNPPRLSRTIISSGANLPSLGWTVNLLMSFKPTGWNKFWRPETGLFESISVAADPASIIKPHTPAAFSVVL